MIKSLIFIIICEYKKGCLLFYYMDVYCLEDVLVDEFGLEEYFYGVGVSVVEWV